MPQSVLKGLHLAGAIVTVDANFATSGVAQATRETGANDSTPPPRMTSRVVQRRSGVLLTVGGG